VTDKDYPDKVIWDLCLRKQNAAREITIEYSAQINKQKGPVLWYGAGAEKGFVEFFKEKGVDLRFRTAAKNKQSRAANMLEAWQDGRILVAQSKIAQVCLDEVINFTGDPRHHDDVVDALAAAYTLYEEDKARTLNVAQRRDRITRAFGFE
jgi:phage terminase large subunit-like protein